jgi:hypothetical protein
MAATVGFRGVVAWMPGLCYAFGVLPSQEGQHRARVWRSPSPGPVAFSRLAVRSNLGYAGPRDGRTIPLPTSIAAPRPPRRGAVSFPYPIVPAQSPERQEEVRWGFSPHGARRLGPLDVSVARRAIQATRQRTPIPPKRVQGREERGIRADHWTRTKNYSAAHTPLMTSRATARN